ncbi:M23 family metallopeptidase [Actinomyces sp.]|uniref:M23 family metallopeptidase n=1 Tax=Actinomyces sp. TaxID=29317 RepID=UPI0026DD367E|nr:M23 family metallopeptidase [Actinomyces sp.]MDO4899904.1 M23 family metallopeptidase [Actinomyces sp.]
MSKLTAADDACAPAASTIPRNTPASKEPSGTLPGERARHAAADRSPGGSSSDVPPRPGSAGLRHRVRHLAAGGAALAACTALSLLPAPVSGAAASSPEAATAPRPVVMAWRGGDPNPVQAFAAGSALDSAATLPGAVTRRVRYSWPTGMATTVLADFDPPAVVWGSGHRGVDLALAAGSRVLAAADGTVAFAGMVAGRPVVSIDHADGIRTTYEPVDPQVKAGDVVTRGQVIGTLQSGHRADGADALHWGARTGPKTYVNPLRLLQPAVIRLKPLN